MPISTRSVVFCSCLAASALFPSQVTQAATLAYYRFEGGSLAELISPVEDASGASRPLHPWGPVSRDSGVPVTAVPSTGLANLASVRFRGDSDLFSPADTGLSAVCPRHFTVEAWVKFEALEGVQTIVGRDDNGEGAGRQSLFYLSKGADVTGPEHTPNAFRVELVTRDNHVVAINSTHAAQVNVWYHLAAVGDAATGVLSLYVDGRNVGSATGFTGLFCPTGNGMWTLGRGQFNGRVADRFNGWLDEVRFSDEALRPDRFLNAAATPPTTAFVRPAPAAAQPAPLPVLSPDPAATAGNGDRAESTASDDSLSRRPGPLWPAKR